MTSQISKKRFWSIYFRSFCKPSGAYAGMVEGNYFRNGFLYMMIPLVLYTLMYILLYLGNGAPSTFTPWLNISRENYYFWNQFLVAPGMILAWFAAAAYSFAVYLFAFPALFYRTVRTVHRVGRGFSLFAAFTGFILFQVIFLIFNR